MPISLLLLTNYLLYGCETVKRAMKTANGRTINFQNKSRGFWNLLVSVVFSVTVFSFVHILPRFYQFLLPLGDQVAIVCEGLGSF